MTHYFVDQFLTWDEVHRKFIPVSGDGCVHTPYKYNIMKFPYNQNGKLEISNGTNSIEKVTLTKCNYTDEVRICLGVAVVTPVIDSDETFQEVRSCKPFVSLGKTLLSMTEFEKKFHHAV